MAARKDYLLDTGILILYARASAPGQAIEAEFQFLTSLFKPMVSVVTLGEARAFARYRGWPKKQGEQLENILAHVVPIDINSPEVMEAYAEIYATARSKGWALGNNDTWIAATAHVIDATLLTTDKDFDPFHNKYINRIYIDPKTGRIA